MEYGSCHWTRSSSSNCIKFSWFNVWTISFCFFECVALFYSGNTCRILQRPKSLKFALYFAFLFPTWASPSFFSDKLFYGHLFLFMTMCTTWAYYCNAPNHWNLPAISRRRPSMENPLVFTLQSLLGAFSRVFSGVCIFILNYLPYRSWLASQQTNFYSELSR